MQDCRTSHLVSVRVTPLSEPKPQKLFVNTLWFFTLCMPGFVGFFDPVSVRQHTAPSELGKPEQGLLLYIASAVMGNESLP